MESLESGLPAGLGNVDAERTLLRVKQKLEGRETGQGLAAVWSSCAHAAHMAVLYLSPAQQYTAGCLLSKECSMQGSVLTRIVAM